MEGGDNKSSSKIVNAKEEVGCSEIVQAEGPDREEQEDLDVEGELSRFMEEVEGSEGEVEDGGTREAVEALATTVREASRDLYEWTQSGAGTIPASVLARIDEAKLSLPPVEGRNGFALFFVLGEFWTRVEDQLLEGTSPKLGRLDATSMEVAAIAGVSFDAEKRTFTFPTGEKVPKSHPSSMATYSWTSNRIFYAELIFPGLAQFPPHNFSMSSW